MNTWTMTVQWPEESVAEDHILANVYDEFGADMVGIEMSKNEGVSCCVFELNSEGVCLQAFGYSEGMRTFHTVKVPEPSEGVLN